MLLHKSRIILHSLCYYIPYASVKQIGMQCKQIQVNVLFLNSSVMSTPNLYFPATSASCCVVMDGLPHIFPGNPSTGMLKWQLPQGGITLLSHWSSLVIEFYLCFLYQPSNHHSLCCTHSHFTNFWSLDPCRGTKINTSIFWEVGAFLYINKQEGIFHQATFLRTFTSYNSRNKVQWNLGTWT